MPLAFGLIAWGVALVLVQEVFRRRGPWTTWVAFLALPLVLTPYWVQHDRSEGFLDVFPWVKLYILLFSTCWITGLRFTRLGAWSWARSLGMLLLPINIVVAVAHDLFGGHLAHSLLAASGLLLIVTLPASWVAVQIDREGHYRDLHWVGMTRAWIMEYTLWNWVFVYLNYRALAGQQLAVLLAAFAVGMIDPRRWLQARAYTLATDLLMAFTFPTFLLGRLDHSSRITAPREDLAAGISLILVTAYAVRGLLKLRRGGWPGSRPNTRFDIGRDQGSALSSSGLATRPRW